MSSPYPPPPPSIQLQFRNNDNNSIGDLSALRNAQNLSHSGNRSCLKKSGTVFVLIGFVVFAAVVVYLESQTQDKISDQSLQITSLQSENSKLDKSFKTFAEQLSALDFNDIYAKSVFLNATIDKIEASGISSYITLADDTKTTLSMFNNSLIQLSTKIDQQQGGINGSQGAQGIPGPPGIRGFNGSTGLRGYNGSNGVNGAQGDMGPRGLNASSYWSSSNGSTIYYNSGNIGIGTMTPSQKLSVVGTIESIDGGFKFPDGSSQYKATALLQSTSWDISTSVFKQAFDVSSQESNPRGMFFKSDGRKFYIVGGGAADNIIEYDVTIAWDISTALFNQDFSLNSQDVIPEDIYFRSDGLRLYMLGQGNNRVYQYDLSTAWDISTLLFSQSYSVVGQETKPTGLFFKPDGLQLYVVGTNGISVDQYDLSIPWDIFTSSPARVFSVNAQIISPSAIVFESDGTKMLVLGSNKARVYAYDLSVGWDISTSVFNQNFSVLEWETQPLGMYISADGTRMYVVGNLINNVNEFDLAPPFNLDGDLFVTGNVGVGTTEKMIIGKPWDITPSGGLDLSGQESNPRGMFFKSDGRKMFVVGGGVSDNIYEYDLAVAWDAETSVFNQVVFSVNSQDAIPEDIYFRSDGLRLYMLGQFNVRVYQYDLSIAWNISTLVFSQSYSVVGQETKPTGLFFKPDGLQMFIVGTNGDSVDHYDLAMPWDIFTSSPARVFSVNPPIIQPSSIVFRSDGTKMLVLGSNTARIYEYDLSVGWDISTSVFNKFFSVITWATQPLGMYISADESKLYVVGNLISKVTEFDISYIPSTGIIGQAWDVSGSVFYGLFNVRTQEANPRGLFFQENGKKMYIVGGGSDDNIIEYDLSIAWDVSTSIFIQVLSLNPEDPIPEDIFFRSDGLKLYMIGDVNNRVYEYDLSTAWDISTLVFNRFISVVAEDNAPKGLFFRSDGTNMYIVGKTGDNVYQYDLTIAWDVSTASANGVFSVIAEPQAISFKSDGSKMFVAGRGSGNPGNPGFVYEYDLTVPWNVSTSVYNQNFSVYEWETQPLGMYMRSDGTKMYVVGNLIGNVNEFDLVRPIQSGNLVVLGNVGIGTSLPQARLQVNGNVKVIGGSLEVISANIIVTRGSLQVASGDIKVTGGGFIDDGTTLSVPDYVFEDDYPLKSIPEVMQYISDHKHLDGLPDANDIKKWAAMTLQARDMKLLEKIEELTLYIAQQHQRSNLQDEIIQNMRERIEENQRSNLQDEIIQNMRARIEVLENR